MRHLIKILLVSITVLPAKWGTAAGQESVSIKFPVEQYTLDTIKVNTSTGIKEIVFRSYKHIPYVSHPVDLDYQSLNVNVPVEINGDKVTPEHAPILFNIGVGGYMSVRNRGGQERRRMSGSSISDLALAAGYVVVSPGCRGRDNQDQEGNYYGKAPAAIVDLKAAVRYIRYNDGLIPGDANHIISNGCSAGGALSALLGSSGDSELYQAYLHEIGAANVQDHIFASACFSPITDLEHSDMAYEWMYGNIAARSGLVDQTLSVQLKDLFAEYQTSLNLHGKHEFGILNADNYQDYLLRFYLIPSATKHLAELSSDERESYLTNNRWMTWSDKGASFAFDDYVKHVGRMKGLPAFDDFQKTQPEPILFGNPTTNARHFTEFSLRYSTGDHEANLDPELEQVVNLMNAMYFIQTRNKACAEYWWIRNGTRDNHTSQTVFGNLVTGLENLGKNVNAWLFWDGGHCANDDPEGLITWIADITGYTNP